MHFPKFALKKCFLNTEMASCLSLYTLCLALCLTHRTHAGKINWMNRWRDEQIHEYYGCYCLAPFGFLLLSKSDGALPSERPTHDDDKTCLFVYRWILFCFMTPLAFCFMNCHSCAKLFVCSFVLAIVHLGMGVMVAAEEIFQKLC